MTTTAINTPADTATLHVFEAMGTVVSVRSARALSERVRHRLAEAFEELEARYSLYRSGSEAAAVATGRLPVARTSAHFRRTLDRALGWRVRTNGAFSPYRPDGSVDLSGIVKAIAIQAAADVLVAHDHHDWCLNAGGDVLTSGNQADGTPWAVGVIDPVDRGRLLSAYRVCGTQRAVATSGYAERGDHVWRTGAEPAFSQVTVAAEDIVTADVLATAILAGGPETLTATERLYRVEVLACCPNGSFWASEAFRG